MKKAENGPEALGERVTAIFRKVRDERIAEENRRKEAQRQTEDAKAVTEKAAVIIADFVSRLEELLRSDGNMSSPLGCAVPVCDLNVTDYAPMESGDDRLMFFSKVHNFGPVMSAVFDQLDDADLCPFVVVRNSKPKNEETGFTLFVLLKP